MHRTSCHPIRTDRLRLALTGTELVKAQGGRTRHKLLRIAARVTMSLRRLCPALPTARPNQAHFIAAYARLLALPLRI